jgi:hypothetical protein
MKVVALLVPEILLLTMFALNALEDLLFPPSKPPQPEEENPDEQPVHPQRQSRSSG